MSTTILATGNGADLVVSSTARVRRALSAMKKTLAALGGAIRELVVNDQAAESELRKLYRLSATSDSITPELIRALQKRA